MKKITTHYDNLQVAQNASPSVVRAAFKALSQKWHPDKHHDNREFAERNYQIIKRAYDVLSDPESRVQHDLWISQIQAEKTTPVKESNRFFKHDVKKEKRKSISVVV